VSIRDRIWPYAISILAATSAVLVVLDLPIPPRAILVLAFATVCPGMALIRLLRLDEPLAEFLLAIVVSLALSGVVATATVYAGAWDAQVVLLALVELTLVAVLADLLRSDRSAA
jgi:uncharacterized membrane protein